MSSQNSTIILILMEWERNKITDPCVKLGCKRAAENHFVWL